MNNSKKIKPVVFDLFCGLGGWSEAFIEQGYRAVGFDIEAHDYGSGGYPGELVLRDIRSISGAELVATYGVPACIVASPPCQEFSYMAMPWSKAKEKRRKILASETEKMRLTDLFNQCFRIQREVSEAVGHHVTMVVENVRGAQEWVGKARWNFGSFYLWGDVPALMPIPQKASKVPGFRFDGNGGSFQTASVARCEGVKAGDRNKGAATGEHKWSKSFADTLNSEGNKMGSSPGKVWRDRPPNVAAHRELTRGEGNKTAGMNWSDQTKRGQDFTRIAGKQAMEGQKHKDQDGYDYNGITFGWKAPATSSKSNLRKKASAEIAKIPPSLANWIARCFKT